MYDEWRSNRLTGHVFALDRTCPRAILGEAPVSHPLPLERVTQPRQPSGSESPSRQDTVSRLLKEVASGDREAFDRLVPLVYDELREVARRQRRHWHGDDTLGTTALIHEAYLRLADHSTPGWTSRPHFLAVASRAMRQVLLDYAKRQHAEKRGGARRRVSVEEIDNALQSHSEFGGQHAEALLAVEDALVRLEQDDPSLARVVECRFHGGLTIEDSAVALEISPATVKRRWALAQAWLYRDLTRTDGAAG